MTKVLGKAELLSADLLKRELYPIPGTDAAVWMREMTTEHMLEFKRMTEALQHDGVKETSAEQDIEIMTTVISFSICDDKGNLLFDTPEEARGLTQNNFNTLMDLGNKALELSGVKQGKAEDKDNLPNAPMMSLSANSPLNSDEQEPKS